MDAQQIEALRERISLQMVSSLPPPERGLATKGKSMSIEGKMKEAAGFVKEEINEHGKSPESQQKAQEGRDLRNEGRMEDGKAPKTSEPGTGHPEK